MLIAPLSPIDQRFLFSLSPLCKDLWFLCEVNSKANVFYCVPEAGKYLSLKGQDKAWGWGGRQPEAVMRSTTECSLENQLKNLLWRTKSLWVCTIVPGIWIMKPYFASLLCLQTFNVLKLL